jgi:nitrite reductase/ring-hydroxylating ferredoxin subunit
MNYVRNCWYVAGWAQDLSADAPLGVRILDEPIVLWRTVDGSVSALEDRCVHRLAPLSLGRCEAGKLRCLYHGLLFDAGGIVVEIPGQDMIPPQARVRSYPVVEQHSWIWVWMGDAAAADPMLIPPAVGFDHPDYILGRGQLDYAAEARLINDNLLDFTHLAYVHAKSFGVPEDYAYDRPKVMPLDRGVRFERWTFDQSAMPGQPEAIAPERFQTYDFLLPGVLLMTGGNFPTGTAAACNHGEPDMALAESGVTFTSQAVTPISEKSARYFFSWGPHKDHGDEALRDLLMGIGAMAFEEDRVMIEAQQRVIDGTTNPRIMPTSADMGVTLFNRLVDKFVRIEGKRLD